MFWENIETSNFDIISNSILSVRTDCFVANGLTTFAPEKNSNFTFVEFLNISSNIEVADIPENILPKFHVDPIDTKNLFTQGMKLDKLHTKLIELENEKRF